MLRSALLLSLCATGCFTTRVLGPPLPTLPERVGGVTVIVEPFFESADWKVTSKAENATVMNMYGSPQNVVVEKQVAEKPVFARIPVLMQEHQAVMNHLRILRPGWRVVSTGQLPQAGPVVLIRTVIGEARVEGSDRTLKTLLTGLGLGIPGLFLRVHEFQKIYGNLSRFDADAAPLRAKLLRYPTQPDFAVDTRGLPVVNQPFGLEIEYEEGLAADELKREAVLVEDFCPRLAVAIVAMVEGIR
jgi:hypothetical protein